MLYTRVVTGSGEDERAEAGEVIVQVTRMVVRSGPRMRNYQPSTGPDKPCTYRGMKMSSSGTVGYRPFRVKRVRFEKDERRIARFFSSGGKGRAG